LIAPKSFWPLAVTQAAMATVNPDGSPHNTPFYLILDDKLEHIYFGSHPKSVHTQNVVRTGQLFVVVYDLRERGGLYMKAENGHELHDKELMEGLAVHSAFRVRDGRPALPPEYYNQPDSSQRMYGADLTTFWVNIASRGGSSNHIIREYRHEIAQKQLLN
jgi:hypothetical protein